MQSCEVVKQLNELQLNGSSGPELLYVVDLELDLYEPDPSRPNWPNFRSTIEAAALTKPVGSLLLLGEN